MFFCFNQNNSGGSFAFDEKSGLTHYVVIEAANQSSANARAELIGIYFNGCDDGQDCPCCGDRWSEAWDDGKDSPAASVGYTPSTFWMKSDKEMAVHYLDGHIEWFGEDNWPK